MPRNQQHRSDDLWRTFAQRHKKNRFLRLNPLYALPERLIEIIAGKRQTSAASGRGRESNLEVRGVAPGFLSEEEAEFERDLARTINGGFFRNRHFGCPFVKQPSSEPDPRGEELREAWAEALVDEGRLPGTVHAGFADRERYESKALQRAVAYAGWLVTNTGFRQERDGLKEAWGRQIEEAGRFPCLPLVFLGEGIGPQLPDHRANAHFMEFYQRWGLTRLLTWDIPVPLAPSLKNYLEHDNLGLGAAGANLFIPWYLLRDGRFGLKEITAYLKRLHGPLHLAGWLKTAAAAQEKLGDTRYSHIFWLYRYQKLGVEIGMLAGRALGLNCRTGRMPSF